MRFQCDSCGARYRVAELDSGKVADIGARGVRARCRRCGAWIVALPRLVLGRYRVVAKVGACHLGDLYAARDETAKDAKDAAAGARVCVLSLHAGAASECEGDSAILAIESAARAAVNNPHPDVATVVAAGAEDTRSYVVLEHFDGRSLREIDEAVPPRQPLPRAVVVGVVAAVARALAWAHERGVAHGHIDVDDIWLPCRGGVKLLGLFCASPTRLAHPVETAQMRDDIRALGALFFRLLTATRHNPYLANAFDDVDDMDMDPALAHICREALAGKVTARAIAEALAFVATDVTVELAKLACPPEKRRRDSAARSGSGVGGSGGSDGGASSAPAALLDRTAVDPVVPDVPDVAGDDDSTTPIVDERAWLSEGAPSLVAAARHREERDDVTQRLGDEDARALASLLVDMRHRPVWWIEIGCEGARGRVAGPVTFDEVHRRAQGGVANARSLVWCRGMSAWRELRHVDAAAGARLFDQFALSSSPSPAAPGALSPTESAFMNEALPQRIWDYDIVARLADGGQGTVYLARDPANGYDVALKSISLESAGARARFEREVHALLGTQGHPNIVQLSRWTIDDDARRGYLAFSYIPGRSLGAIIDAEGRAGLALDRALDLAEQIALGLAKLHERTLIHRDLKPANVMVRQDPGRETAILIDLGIAKLLHVSSAAAASTQLISPQYAAPERFGLTEGAHGRGDGGGGAGGGSAGGGSDGVDHRSDLYSLGLLLFEMLTGAHPFAPASDILQLALAHTTRLPPDPRAARTDVPDALATLTLRLLAKDPRERPSTAMQVVQQLRDIERELRARSTERTKATKRKRKTPAATAAAAPAEQPASLRTRIKRALALDTTSGEG